MSIQGDPMSESTGKFTKFTVLLIKSVRVTQTRTCVASAHSHTCTAYALYIVMMCSWHRYGKN